MKIENYEILYRGNLPEGKRSVPQAELLEQLYQKFNCARPTDCHGHSLSVSDVIMLHKFQFVDLKQNTVPYIAVMRFGAWLLIFCERSSIK